jgi:hypothetical protein
MHFPMFAPIVLVVLAAILIIVGSAPGPEKREPEMHLPDLGVGPAPSPAPCSAPHPV